MPRLHPSRDMGVRPEEVQRVKWCDRHDDLLVKDLDKEMTEAETTGKDAQADYETLMADSADKRTADSKSLQEKGSTKAELEGSLEDHQGKDGCCQGTHGYPEIHSNIAS